MSDTQVLRETVLLLDGNKVTQEQLNEAKKNLPSDKKIIETAPGNYSTKTVLHG
jgi:hypothetical protein